MPLLPTTKAPALPLAERNYSRDTNNRFSNILRLYFNQIDSVVGGLLGTNGGQYLQFPHVAASDSTNQYAAGDNTPTLVAWNTLETISGFTLSAGYVTAGAPGIYKVDYSLQLTNTDNASHDVFVWLQTNGTIVPGSSSRFTVPARKSIGNNGYLVAYSSVEFEINSADEIRLWWATEKAYNTVGPVDGVYMEALPAQTTPYVRPSNPSAVGSINYVSRLAE